MTTFELFGVSESLTLTARLGPEKLVNVGGKSTPSIEGSFRPHWVNRIKSPKMRKFLNILAIKHCKVSSNRKKI